MNWVYLILIIFAVWLVVLTFFVIANYGYNILQDEELYSMRYWCCDEVLE